MKTDTTIYDIAGIGIGPFNLGLAALSEPIKTLKTIFIEQKPAFSWHEGMLIPGSLCRYPIWQTWLHWQTHPANFHILIFSGSIIA